MPLRQQKYKKNILGCSQKRVRSLSGWSYAPRYSCRSKAKVNCFLHTNKKALRFKNNYELSIVSYKHTTL